MTPLDRLSPAAAERFLSNIREEGTCWVWVGFTDDRGYGRLQVAGHQVYAHHIAGVTKRSRRSLSCPNRSCINPAHWLSDVPPT